ncbi:hypothetical protein COB28_03575 [Candidatus Dependentiae bacterium]|nr:MAG: hypothetical protein COB28_03575 [Candidatus Dependentiae bacterium]
MKKIILFLTTFGMLCLQQDLLADESVHHTHVIQVSEGPSFDEMVESGSRTLVPGFITGSLEGAVEAFVSLMQSSDVALKNKYLALPASDLTEAVSSILIQEWRENSEEFQQRNDETGSYVVDKCMHNIMKYIVGLLMVDMFVEEKDIEKSKSVLLERFINNLVRDRQVDSSRFSKILLESVFRSATEGFYIKDVNGKKDFVWNPLVGISAFMGSFAGALLSGVLFDSGPDANRKSKRSKRMCRLASTMGGSLMKSVALSRAGKEFVIMETDKDSYLFDTKIVAGSGLGLVSVAWLSQHKDSVRAVHFANGLVDLCKGIFKIIELFKKK